MFDFEKSLYEELLELENEELFVHCEICDDTDIAIVTTAKHTSSSFPLRIPTSKKSRSTYVVQNSDQSWSVDDQTTCFLCLQCGHTSAIDVSQTPILWEWI